MKSTIRLRRLAYLLIILITALSVFYWWRLAQGHDNTRVKTMEMAKRRALQLAEVEGHHVEALILALDSSLKQFRDALQAHNTQGAKLIAQGILNTYPKGAIVHLARIDVKGYFEYTTVNLNKPVYVGDRDYFQFYQKHNGLDRLFINKPIFSRSAHRWVMLMTRPIKKNGRFDGAAFISLSPNYFANMLSKLTMEPNDVSAILLEDGTYVARNQGLEEILGKRIQSNRPLLESDAPRQGIFEAEGSADKIKRLYAWYKLDGYPLIVAVGLDQNAILKPVNDDIQANIERSLYGNAAIFILTLGIALLLIRASHQQKALATSESLFRKQSLRLEEVIWGTNVGTWEWLVEEDKMVINDLYAEMLGYTKEEFIQLCREVTRQNIRQFIHPADIPACKEKIERCFRREVDIYDCELRMRCKNGEWRWVLSRGRVVEWSHDDKPLRISGTNQDISTRKHSEEKLQYIAHYDLLTGLPNRVLLAERMAQAIEQSRQRNNLVAVAYIDLDGFKQVNDLYGHDVGDQLLVAIAKRMQNSMRSIDTLARIGGDEFVALLGELKNAQDCEAPLERLLEAAAESIPLLLDQEDTVNMRVSASIGVTIYPHDDGDADQLLRHADQAMYAAKQMGKNRYCVFDIEHATAQAEKFESLEHIRRGFENSEFILHYQPKVNIKTGELIGAEALIRWAHPERGLLQPGSFLPAIENHPLSLDVGKWVIDTALKQILQWQEQGMYVPISVNVGAFQLQHPSFTKQLSLSLANHPHVAPSSLELEILETSALGDITYVSEVMQNCHDMGVRFALDDFGTAYSSLIYLKQLPIDVIKIDRSFIRDISTKNKAIVSGIISLANAFKLMVIAEGIETTEQGQLLIDMGCELAQGYAIAKPMPASELLGWTGQWHPPEAWKAAETA